MGDNDPKRPTDPARSTEKQAPPSPSAPTDSSRPASNAANPSLASRIQASASGLLNSALSSSSPSARDGISATLAASLADKGGPSGGGGGSSGRAAGGTSTLSKERLRSSSSTAHATFKSSGSSIRSGSTTSATTGWEELETWETRHGGQPEQFSFFDELDREAAVLSSQGKGKAKQRDHGPGDQQDRSSFERAWEAHSVASEQQHAHQERRSSQPQAQLHNPALDGHAVTALLADPFFDPLSQDPAELEADLDAADQPNPYLSPPPGITTTTTTTTTTQLNPLSLLPGLEDMLASIPLQDQPTASASRANLDQRLTAEDLATLSSLLPPSDEPWLSLDALYHDAVYGNLLAPHVAAAKREVDERGSRRRATEREGETPVETGPGPAVRRLGLILGHLRGKMAAERAGNNSGNERQGRETV